MGPRSRKDLPDSRSAILRLWLSDFCELLNMDSAPFNYRKTVPRPRHVQSRVERPYVPEDILNFEGTLSKPIKRPYLHLSSRGRARIDTTVPELSISHPWFDEEPQPAGKDPRHDRQATLRVKYNESLKDVPNHPSFEEALERTKQEVLITSEYYLHTSKSGPVNANLSQALRHWTYGFRLPHYKHVYRLTKQGKFETRTGQVQSHRRFLLMAVAHSSFGRFPVFSQLCSDALSSAQMFTKFKQKATDVVGGVTNVIADGVIQGIGERLSNRVSQISQALSGFGGFIATLWEKIRSYAAILFTAIDRVISPLSVSLILLVVFLSLALFFTGLALARTTFGSSTPIEAVVNTVVDEVGVEPQFAQADFFTSKKLKDFDEWTRRIGSTKNAIQSIKWFWDCALDCIDYFYEKATGLPWSERAKDKKSFTEAHQEAVDVFESYVEPLSTVQHSKVISAYKGLLEMSKTSARLPDANAAIVTLLNRYRPIYLKALSLVVHAQREQPVVIAMYGVPGAAKSTLIPIILREIAPVLSIDPTSVYHRRYVNDYWDGYRNQDVVVYDDFLINVDTNLRNAEASEFIDCANSIPKQLHMSAVEDKSTTFFTSRVIVLTSNSNLANVHNLGIQDVRALTRRINYRLRFTKPVDPARFVSSLRMSTVELSMVAGYDDKGELRVESLGSSLVYLTIKRLVDIMRASIKPVAVTLDDLNPANAQFVPVVTDPVPPEPPRVSVAGGDHEIDEVGHVSGGESDDEQQFAQMYKKRVQTLMGTPSFDDDDRIALGGKPRHTGQAPTDLAAAIVRDIKSDGEPGVAELLPDVIRQTIAPTVAEETYVEVLRSFPKPPVTVPMYTDHSLMDPLLPGGKLDKGAASESMYAQEMASAFYDKYVNSKDDRDFHRAKNYLHRIGTIDADMAAVFLKPRPRNSFITHDFNVSYADDVTSGVFLEPWKCLVTHDHKVNALFSAMLLCGLGDPGDVMLMSDVSSTLKSCVVQEPGYYKYPTVKDLIGTPFFYFEVTTRKGIEISVVPAKVLEYWRRIASIGSFTSGPEDTRKLCIPYANIVGAFKSDTAWYLYYVGCMEESYCLVPFYPGNQPTSPPAGVVFNSWVNKRLWTWKGWVAYYALISAAVVAFIAAVVSVISHFFGRRVDPVTHEDVDAVFAQSSPEPGKALKKKLVKVGPKPKKMTQEEFRRQVEMRRKENPQMATDMNRLASVATNLKSLRLRDKDGEVVGSSLALAVKGGAVLLATHAWQMAVDDDLDLVLEVSPGTVHRAAARDIQAANSFANIPGKDMTLVLFRHTVGRDIIKHFADSYDDSISEMTRVILDKSGLIHYETAMCRPRDQATYTDEKGNAVVISANYTYLSPGQAGFCSAPYFSGTKVRGLHVAGNDTISTVVVLTSVELRKALNDITEALAKDEKAHALSSPYLLPRAELPEELFAQGEFATSHQVRATSVQGTCGPLNVVAKMNRPKFSQVKSELQLSTFMSSEVKPWPLNTAPAALRPVNGVDPFDVWAMKFQGKQTEFVYKNSDLMSSWDGVFPQLSNRMTYYMYTFDQVIDGVPDRLPPLDRKHSPGGFWVLRGLSRGQVIAHHRAELQRRVEHIISFIKRGIPPPLFYVAEPKDEKRLKEKVDACDTRFILVAPLEWLIVNIMYLGFFMDIRSRYFWDSDIMIGLNPYGLDWGTMARDLCYPVCSDADAKSWDVQYPIPVALQYPYQASRRYVGVPVEELNCIFISTFYANVLHHDVILEADMMPSGDYKTAELNSAVNSVGSRSVFDEFPQAYSLKVLGDDKISSHEEGFPVEKANQMLIDRYHWKMTDAAKGGLPTAKPLSECQFLKRRVVLDGSHFMAPLDIQSIRDMLTWVHAKQSVREVVQKSCDNWEVARRELSLHPKHVYDTYCRLLEPIVEKDNLLYLRIPHAEMRQAVKNMSIRF